jgi:stage IV sporulation protein FB
MLFFMTAQLGHFPSDFSVILHAVQRPGTVNIFTYLVITNLFLGLFNLLPAFPMDGGRILRSLLAMTMSYVRATQIAVFVGRLLAGLLAIAGLFTFNIWLLLIAFFIYVGGSAEREAVENKAVLRHFTAGQALTRTAVNLYASERLSRAVELIMTSYQTDYPVLDLAGKFIGVLTRPLLVRALQSNGPETRVIDVMMPAEDVLMAPPTATLAEVWDLMATHGSRVVAVKNGAEFLGLITLEDMNEVFQVMGASISKNGNPSPPSNTTPTPTNESNERTPADA